MGTIDERRTTNDDLSGREGRTQKKSLTDRSETFKIPLFETPKCSRDKRSNDELSIRLATCNAKLDEAYDALWERWGDKKESAESLGANRRAQEKLDELSGDTPKGWDSSCGPIRHETKARAGKMCNPRVDAWVESPPTPLLARVMRPHEEMLGI